METTYYLLSNVDTGEPRFVFRERPGYIERWDTETATWLHDGALYTYVVNGEVGAQRITEGRAQEIIDRLGAKVDTPS